MPTMLRPKMTVLPASALVSKRTRAGVEGPTHEVVSRQPFYTALPDDITDGAEPDGYLSKGARVRLLRRGRGRLCQVLISRGRAVMTAFSGLRTLA